MSPENYVVLYITDASEREVQALYIGLEAKGFYVESLKTDVPGYAYGAIRTSVHRTPTVKEGRMVLVRREEPIDTSELGDIINSALPESADVQAFPGNVEYRTNRL